MAKDTKNHQHKTILNLFWEISKPYTWRRNFALIGASLNFAVGMFVIPLIIAGFLDRYLGFYPQVIQPYKLALLED